MLRCSNEECDTRTDEQEPFFDISVTVDSDRDLAESLNGAFVDACFFRCCHCGDPAEEVNEMKEAV